MAGPSRRHFIGSLAAGVAVSSVAAGQQTTAPAPARSRNFSMKLGVHMTNWEPLWRKGVVTWEDIARINSELGFQGIELQADNVEKEDQAGLKRIKAALSSKGLRINAINIGNNFLAPDFDAQVKMVKDFAELCNYFEAPFERIYLGRKPPEMGDAKAFDLVRKGLETCLPTWERLGVVAAPEPPDVFRFRPVNSGTGDSSSASVVVEVLPKQFPAGDITGIVALLKVIDSKYFRYTLDSGCIPPEEKYVWPQLLAPYTVNMHIKEWQFHWRTSDPTDTDYVRFLQPFKDAGYNGFLDLELRDSVRGGFDLGDTPAEVSAKLVKLKTYLERCIAA